MKERSFHQINYYLFWTHKGASCRSDEPALSIPPPTVTFSPPSVDCGVILRTGKNWTFGDRLKHLPYRR